MDKNRKKVFNKQARYNLCFAEEGQTQDLLTGQQTVISYSDVRLLKYFRNNLPTKLEKLPCEANYYYDVTKCGIGFHGDDGSKNVIGVRLGASVPLHFQWFTSNKPVGERAKVLLNHGDMYIMSEKATGFDWKSSSKVTLRHAAGAKKFLTIK